jgi:glycine/D-amino acid oxidase-like deaminating enzyme
VDVSSWPLLIAPGGAHTRPAEGNRLMMAWEERPQPLADAGPDELYEDQDTIDPGFGLGIEDYGLRVLAELARHVPLLGERVALAQATCGWYALTPDHKAILGEDPRIPGLFHASGFAGHGIMHAGATGLTLAEIVLGREPSLLGAADLEGQFGLSSLLATGFREPAEDLVL